MPTPPPRAHPQPLSFRRSAPSTVTHHPLPLPSSPQPFRSRPSPTSSPARPVPIRPRPSSYTLHRPLLPDSHRSTPPPPSTATVTPAARSRSHNELRPLARPSNSRVVSFGSAVTPASPGSTTDGDENVSAANSDGPTSQGRVSWEWPWDEDEAKLRSRVPSQHQQSPSSSSQPYVMARREDSSGSGSSFGDRFETRPRRPYARPASAAGARSQSALAGDGLGVASASGGGGGGGGSGCMRGDGPRPWDMTELSGGKSSSHFASFGAFRKGGWEAFEGSSRHLGRGKGKVKEGEQQGLKWEEGRVRRRFRLFGRGKKGGRGIGFLKS